jgi:hypothetical protein
MKFPPPRRYAFFGLAIFWPPARKAANVLRDGARRLEQERRRIMSDEEPSRSQDDSERR